MAKKETLKSDPFDMDSDLDFSFSLDADLEGINPEAEKKDRNPVIDVAIGVKEGLKDKFTDPSFLAQVTRKVLPEQYGTVFDKAGQVSTGLGRITDEAIKEVKPHAKQLVRKIDKLVPAESTTAKKVLEKFKSILGDDFETTAGTSEEQQKEQQITSSLNAVFAAQAQMQQQQQNRDDAKERVDDAIEAKRFRNLFDVAASTESAVQRVAKYTETINQAYQKKSLELQFRQYFATAESLRIQREYYGIFKSQNEAIAKNTALPEFQKIHLNESFRENMRGKFMESMRKGLFGDKDLIEIGMTNLRREVMTQARSFKDSLRAGIEGAEGIESLKETNKMMAEFDPNSVVTAGQLGGQVAGGFIGEKIGDKIGSTLRGKINEDSPIARFGYKLAKMARNLGGTVESLYQNQDLANSEFDPGLKGKAAQFARWGLNLFREGGSDNTINGNGALNNLKGASIFDNKAHRSLVEIIPGYLSRILREQVALRTNNPNAALTRYDFKTGQFVSEKRIAEDIKKTLASKLTANLNGYHSEKASQFLLEGREVSPEQTEEVKNFLRRSAKKMKTFDTKSLTSSSLFKNLRPETAKLIREQLESKLDNADLKEKADYEFTSKMSDVRESTPEAHGEIEAFIQAGYADVLAKEGLITIRPDGSYEINTDKYDELIEKHPTSDVNAKKGISKFNPKNALNAIKKTKIYNWFYKTGRGDEGEHTGPMAGDVRKHMGEEAAPGGKSLDLTTVNGFVMAAVQELTKRVESMTENKTSEGYLKSIDATTKAIYEKLGKGFSGTSSSNTSSSEPETSGYGGHIKNIFKGLFGLGQDGIKDTKEIAGKVYDNAKENVVKPATHVASDLYKGGKTLITDLYSGIKDPAGRAFKNFTENTFNLGSHLMQFAKTTINERVPAALKLTKDLLTKGKNLLLDVIDEVGDVYIKGKVEPVIRAELLRAGYYYDQATGQVIQRASDIKGTVVNKAGEVVLSLDEMKDGLYDIKGRIIESPVAKLAYKAFRNIKANLLLGKRSLKKLFNKAKDKYENSSLKDGFESAKQKAFSMKDNAQEWMSNIQGFNIPFGFSDERSYKTLIEIRDILRAKLLGEDVLPKEFHTPKESSFKGISDSVEKGIESVKEKAQKVKETVQSKIAEAKNQANDTTGETKPGMLGKLFGLKDKIKDIFSKENVDGKKDQAKGYFNQLSSFFKGKEGDPKISLKDRWNNLKDKFSNKKEGEENPSTEKTSLKDKLGKLKDAFKEKKDSAKSKIGEKIDNFKKAFNDRDGSGKRDGSWEDRLKEQEEAKKNKKQNVSEVDLKAKYKTDSGMFGGLIGTAMKVISNLGSGISGLFSMASGLFSVVGGLFGLGGKAGILGKAAGLLGGALKLPFKAMGAAARFVGSPLVNLVQGASKVGTVARVASVANTVRNVALAGSLVTGGVGSAIMGTIGVGMTAIAAALTSPVIIGAAAIAATGYGAYRAYKYLTRNDMDDFQTIRLGQYGLLKGNKKHEPVFHKVIGLENYLLDGRIGYNNGVAYLLERKLNPKEMFAEFGIDEEDTEMQERFMTWFNKRFKPFFLTHATALFSVNPKVKVSDVKKLKIEEQIKYLGLVSYDNGPYNVDISPFKEIDGISIDRDYALNRIKQLIAKLKNTQPEDKKSVDEKKERFDQNKESQRGDRKDQVDANKTKGDSPEKQAASNTGGEGEDPSKSNKVIPEQKSLTIGNQRLVIDEGPIKDGSSGNQYLNFGKETNVEGLNPSLLQNLRGMSQDYYEKTGKKLSVNEAKRSFEQQKALYNANPGKAAPPGSSLHEVGLAVDMPTVQLDELEKMGLMRKYGFTRPVGGESWHAEPAGIQVNIKAARNNPQIASMMIDSGLLKGGGGIGAIKPAVSVKRDPTHAASIMEASASRANAPAANDSDKDTVAAFVNNRSGNTEEKAVTEPKQVAASGYSDRLSKMRQGVQSTKNEVADMETKRLSRANEQNNRYSTANGLSEDAEVKPANAKVTEINKPIDGRNREEVKKRIETIATKTGNDPEQMATIAACESGLNPNAASRDSTAKGLFQFVDDTWEYQKAKYGKKYDIDPNTPATDVNANICLASEYIKQNRRGLSDVKSNPNLTDIYLAHFLGLTGAKKFLKSDSDAIGAEVLPKAAKANKSIFYSNGRALTVSEIYQNLSRKLLSKAKEYNTGLTEAEVGDGQFSGESKKIASAKTETPVNTPSSNVVPIKPQSVNYEQHTVKKPESKQPALFNQNTYGSNPMTSSERGQSVNLTPVSDAINDTNKILSESLEVQKGLLEAITALIDQQKTSKADSGNRMTPQESAPQRSPIMTRRQLGEPAVNIQRTA